MEPGGKTRGRELKQQIRQLLTQDDFRSALAGLCRLPAREVISPLLSFLFSGDELTKWRAVTAVGAVTSRMADADMESARTVMRRLMWSLNDESGGIGWGAPEAMGEILARHKGLAAEYAHILISYTREDGSYLKHDILQRGVLWGLERLAQASPHLLRDAGPLIPPYLKSSDGTVRGLAAKLCGRLGLDSARTSLERLTGDTTAIRLFRNGEMRSRKVGRLAAAALARLRSSYRHDSYCHRTAPNAVSMPGPAERAAAAPRHQSGDLAKRMKNVASATKPGVASDRGPLYPDGPQVAVGAVVFREGRVLLVRRGRAPAEGLWAIPGGRMELGETLQAAAEREIYEETGIRIRAGAPIFTFDVIERDDDGRVRYHYVIVDMMADYVSGALRPGDDALEARWVSAQALDGLEVSARTLQLLRTRFKFGGQLS